MAKFHSLLLHSYISLIWLVVLCCEMISAVNIEVEELTTQCPNSTNDVDRLLVSYCPETDNDVFCGQKYNFAEIMKHPGHPDVVLYTKAVNDAYYTLMMVDPDAPSSENPIARYWLHWLVTNIKGSDLLAGNPKGFGESLTEYNGPTPPPGTGLHRYYFFLFSQDGRLPQISKPSTRARFDVTEFAERHSLIRLVAVNMFTTEQNGKNV